MIGLSLFVFTLKSFSISLRQMQLSMLQQCYIGLNLAAANFFIYKGEGGHKAVM